MAAARLLQPFLWAFAILLLIRGHNHPGGGFIAGLLASAAVVLHGFAYGMQACWNRLFLRPHHWMALGLGTALFSALIGLTVGDPIMTSQWISPLHIALGTPLLFDLGVCLTVIGVTLTIILSVAARE